MSVNGKKDDNEHLYEIAESCARKLGISQIQSGVPLQYINEHRRIWNSIWKRGEDCDNPVCSEW